MITLGNMLYVRDQNGDFVPVMGGGNGAMTSAQIEALNGMFSIATYKTDPTEAYAAFKAAFGITDSTDPDEPDEPTEPDKTTYAITTILTGCTISNDAASITEGESYSATLTAADGYTLDGATVAITMGGTDITANAYSDGVIAIASVTGDIVINASCAQLGGTITEIVPDIALETKETTSVKYDGNLEGSTTWRIDGVKAGDVIVSGAGNGEQCFASGEWSGRTIYAADDSQVVREFMDGYNWAKYTFTAAQDYDIFWVSSKTAIDSPSYSTDIITWTHEK